MITNEMIRDAINRLTEEMRDINGNPPEMPALLQETMRRKLAVDGILAKKQEDDTFKGKML